jgi:hypothetical protein
MNNQRRRDAYRMGDAEEGKERSGVIGRLGREAIQEVGGKALIPVTSRKA